MISILAGHCLPDQEDKKHKIAWSQLKFHAAPGEAKHSSTAFDKSLRRVINIPWGFT